MATDDELVQRGMEIFRTIADRGQRGLCAHRISRFRPTDYTEAAYCPSAVVRHGAMSCEPHTVIAEAEAREIEARMAEAGEDDEEEWGPDSAQELLERGPR